ncbi:MAG TPA: glycosyltransferase [Ornithinibacter sp.]|nr:glycosyltransferase [Ornithinibacter sp.]
MKIAMVSEHASPLAALGEADAGGQNVHVAALALGLARKGHEVDVYTRRDDPQQPERVPFGPGATVVHVPAGPPRHLPKDALLQYMDAFADWMADDWARTGDPQVVHGHFWMSGLAALRAGRRRGVPVVQTFHALGSVKRRHQRAADTSPAERLLLEHRVATEAEVVVATCSDEVDELRRMGVPTDHVRVVPCGVDTVHFTPSGRPPDQFPTNGRPRLLAVGRLVERKGFDLAVRALADLPAAELVIVGGPPADQLEADPEARRLRSLAAELGVADRLLLTGQLPHAELPAFYRSADVVLAVPWYEPFGITPLEAAACGRPVVGAAVGGLLDSVRDGVTGHLVPPRDVPTLVAAVRALLDDPDEAAAMGRRARARAVEHFDWGVVAARTEEVLEATARGALLPAALRAPGWLEEHTLEVEGGMRSLLRHGDVIRSWGERLASTLLGGGRLLAAGNGGSAAEAQHLTAELVGRWCTDRRPLSAIALCAETSSLTAILNDYGPDEVFARQVEAHGREGDVLVLLSTSGTSSNVLHAAKRGLDAGLQVWAMTGPGPNPLAGLADEALVVDAPSTAAVQEVQLVAIHAVCAALDAALERRGLMQAGPVCRQAS